jgi:hypothetical protein
MALAKLGTARMALAKLGTARVVHWQQGKKKMQ